MYHFLPANCRLRNVLLQTPESRQSHWPLLKELRKPNETRSNPYVFLYSLLPSFSLVLSPSFSLLSPSWIPWVTLITLFFNCYCLKVTIAKVRFWKNKGKWTEQLAGSWTCGDLKWSEVVWTYFLSHKCDIFYRRLKWLFSVLQSNILGLCNI